MDTATGLLIVLALLAVVAVVLAWHWWRVSFAPIPCPYRDRDSQEAEWRTRFDGEAMDEAETVLLFLCDAFCFNPDERYKFKPDDPVVDIYRACYPPTKRWPIGDCREVETLLLLLDKRLGVKTSE